MDFRPDGSVSIKGVKISDDPTIANAELQSLLEAATAWKKIHTFTSGMTDAEFALKQAEAERLRDELLATNTPTPAPDLLTQAPTAILPPGVTVPLHLCSRWSSKHCLHKPPPLQRRRSRRHPRRHLNLNSYRPSQFRSNLTKTLSRIASRKFELRPRPSETRPPIT